MACRINVVFFLCKFLVMKVRSKSNNYRKITPSLKVNNFACWIALVSLHLAGNRPNIASSHCKSKQNCTLFARTISQNSHFRKESEHNSSAVKYGTFSELIFLESIIIISFFNLQLLQFICCIRTVQSRKFVDFKN